MRGVEANRLVEKVLAQWGDVRREMRPIPGGAREMLVVGSEVIAVHPKAYVRYWRHDDGRKEGRHGIREGLLQFYADNDYLLCFYEEDSKAVLLGDPKVLLGRSVTWVMRGAIEGEAEVSRFITRDDMVVVGVTQ